MECYLALKRNELPSTSEKQSILLCQSQSEELHAADFKYMTFWKRQSHGIVKKNNLWFIGGNGKQRTTK